MLPFVALAVTAESHQQLEETSQWYRPPKGSREMLCDDDEDEPFFASNLLYYPELPQPQRVGPYQTYRNWQVIRKQQQQKIQRKQQQKIQRKQQQQIQRKHQQKQQVETQVSRAIWQLYPVPAKLEQVEE